MEKPTLPDDVAEEPGTAPERFVDNQLPTGQAWLLEDAHLPHLRGTKVVATVGPATDGCMAELLAAGVNVCRVNFSHGSADEHRARVQHIRETARAGGHTVAILGDLQGPKIRIGQFEAGTINLEQGASFAIDCRVAEKNGTNVHVGTTYQALARDVIPGDRLVLGDGLIELLVSNVEAPRVDCTVLVGGELSGGKGINKRGGGLSAGALTPKDKVDITLAAELAMDFLAVSFPRTAADMASARLLAREAGLECRLVAKLERAEAVATREALTELILASDVVMVARGDLGIEIDYPALMGVQKFVINEARRLGKATITATQMMESMIDNPVPTRAEVLDVANAVVDGTDAVMLSGETAVGRYPVETVKAMVRVIEGAEQSAQNPGGRLRDAPCDEIDEAVALAVMSVAARLDNVRAVVCFTASGNTPKLLSRYLSRIPIYAMVENPQTLARVALYRGVQPVLFEAEVHDYEAMNRQALHWLKDQALVTAGDRVILAKGDLVEDRQPGGTNTMKIIEL